MARIELDHVSYSYAGSHDGDCALRDISLAIEDGEFVCVVGKSGCGKTTLLRLLAGLTFPDSGEVRIDGRPISGPDTDRSIVFQNYTLFPWMSVRRNVEFGIRQARRGLKHDQIHRIADDFLEKVDMRKDAEKYPCQLSGGMQQRAAIARALAMDTDILLMDEPFGALDMRIRRELQILLENLPSGESGRRKTIVFVTHDINEAVFLADRIVYMTPGRIFRILSVPLPRPRSALNAADADRMRTLHRDLLDLFDMTYRREGA